MRRTNLSPMKGATLLCVSLGILGCSGANELATELGDIPMDLNVISNKTVATTEKVSKRSTKFVPTNPDRDNPFHFAGVYAAEDHAALTDLQKTTVLGFAKTDCVRAILQIRTHSVALAEGESMDGVEVVEINQPYVSLRANDVLWTASLFDRGKASSKVTGSAPVQ